MFIFSQCLVRQSVYIYFKDEKTSKYTKYSVGESRYFGVNENTGDIFVAGILFGQANTVIMSVIHDIFSLFLNKI